MILREILSRHQLSDGFLLKLKCGHLVERADTALAPNQKRVNCPTCVAEDAALLRSRRLLNRRS
jgi:hypothetical protein